MTELSVGDVGATLSAPAPWPFGLYAITNVRLSPTHFLAFQVQPDTAIPMGAVALPMQGGETRFPFGYDVPPDVPM